MQLPWGERVVRWRKSINAGRMALWVAALGGGVVAAKMRSETQGMADGLAALGAVVPSRAVFAGWREELAPVLALCASPERAVLGLCRLFQQSADPLALQMRLYRDSRLSLMLVTVFASSQFLGEIVLRHPEYLDWLSEPAALAHERADDEFRAGALAAVEGRGDEDALLRLLRWQRRELLRIGLGDLAQWIDLPAVTRQLSHLADAVVEACLRMAHTPPGGGLAVLALGKLGGTELNYSSDIDLVLVAAERPEAHAQGGKRLIELLTRMTPEGFLYRVDMRLRPWGQVGPLVASAEGYLAYLHRDARLWERQALLKARAIAGDRALGDAVLRQAGEVIACPDPEEARADVRAMKEKIAAGLRRRGREWGEVKLGRGSIRDIEFVTQYLQLIHCALHPAVLSANTLSALDHLLACGLLPAADHRVLAEGYIFLRPVEHYLQLMHYRQTHALPEDGSEMDYLARRLGFMGEGAGSQFIFRYGQQCAAIRAVYDRYMEIKVDTMQGESPSASASDVGQHVARMAPSYAETFDVDSIRRHAALAARLDLGHLVEVEASPQPNGDWVVTVVAFDYPAELSMICGLLFCLWL
jgi:glutamate-ammonia-ligase adenylyltransferase